MSYNAEPGASKKPADAGARPPPADVLPDLTSIVGYRVTTRFVQNGVPSPLGSNIE
jgi:hypothetical protein